MPTGHDIQFVCEATLHLPLGPSLIKSSSFSPFARLLIAPSDTHQRSFHHTNSAGRAQIAHKHGPATGPHEWRWPNKPRPHIMRSDSLLLRERPGLSRRPFVLTRLQFSEWLSPLDTPWQLGGCWEESSLRRPRGHCKLLLLSLCGRDTGLGHRTEMKTRWCVVDIRNLRPAHL